MKTIFTLLAFLICSSVFAQINVTSNPTLITAGNTTVNEVTIDRGSLGIPTPRLITVLIKLPSTNTGTVQINTLNSDVDDSPSFAAGVYVWITVRDNFWIKQSNGADSIEISW